MDFLKTALITLASGFVSSYLTIRLGLHRDLVNTKRERIEKYAMSLIAIDVMLEKFRQKYLFSNDEVEVDEVALGTVEMLTKLYFRNIHKEFESFNKAVLAFKRDLYGTQMNLLSIRQASPHPSIRPIPTQAMIDATTKLAADAYIERNLLLEALSKAYPLLDGETFLSKIISKIKSQCT